MDLYDTVEHVQRSLKDVAVQFKEIPESENESVTVGIFAELTGLEKEKAWREWVRGSDRVFGVQDVSLVDTLYQVFFLHHTEFTTKTLHVMLPIY